MADSRQTHGQQQTQTWPTEWTLHLATEWTPTYMITAASQLCNVDAASACRYDGDQVVATVQQVRTCEDAVSQATRRAIAVTHTADVWLGRRFQNAVTSGCLDGWNS